MKNLFITRNGFDKSHQAKIPTKSGKFYLSVVAGPHQYSNPRDYVEDCNYTEVELAIFTTENEWASKEQASPVFPIIGKGEYEFEYGNSAVFAYVPIELIEKCIEVL
jgi:hypothetical protein